MRLGLLQAGMWAQPPAVPPPSHYAPPTLPMPAPVVPRDPMGFPPGLIPQLVRVRAMPPQPCSNPAPSKICGKLSDQLPSGLIPQLIRVRSALS